MPKIICTLPNASEEISGVKFISHKDGMISEEISKEKADAFLEIKGYNLAEEKPAMTKAEKDALKKAEKEAAEAAEKAAAEAAEKEAAEKAAAEAAAKAAEGGSQDPADKK